MRTYSSIVACFVVLACGACMNPAAVTPGDDAGAAEPREIAADCDASPPLAASPFALQTGAPNAPSADGEPAQQARLGACRGASTPGDGSCDRQLTGWYALAYDLDVVYQDEAAGDNPAYDPGRGQLRLMFKAALRGTCPDEPPALTALQLCGLTLPPLTSAADGDWQALTIPTEAWDRPTQPAFETRVRASDDMKVEPTRILLGIEPQAQGSDWPTFEDTASFDCGQQRQGSDCFPDHDGDGEPGITVELPQPAAAVDCAGWHLAGVRADGAPWGGRPRASRLFLGLRTQLQGNFVFGADCERGLGAADADDVALRVLDCELEDGARCNAPQATFVDQHAPVFHVLHVGDDPSSRMQPRAASLQSALDLRPSQGGSLTAERLAPVEGSVSCQEVRSALGKARTD
jgi:hypothetical protein